MFVMSRPYGQACPVARSLDLVGDRWTLLIVRDLLRGRGRFRALSESLPGIAPNILSDRLKLLEEHGVVSRRFYSDHPPRAEYVLTDKGRELGVVVGALASWGARHAGSPFMPVHAVCGHPAEVVYRCPDCAELLSREAIELRRSGATAEPADAPPMIPPEKPEPLAGQRRAEHGQPGGVTARTRHAGGEPDRAHRRGRRGRPDRGDGTAGGQDDLRATGHDEHVHRGVDRLGRQGGAPTRLLPGGA